jgi:hypothetical protein
MMDKGDALDYQMLYEKALAENVRLQGLLWQEARNRVEIAAAVEQMRDEIKNATTVERERCIGILRDVLCEDLAEFCIGHIRKGDRFAIAAEREIERLRDALEQAVDDFGDGHCVCEQTKQQCIDALKLGE